MTNAWLSVTGLAIDFLGVGLLGFDLVRLQIRLRQQAKQSRAFLDGLASDYGGVPAWASEIKSSAKWTPASDYSDYHAEDETSFNSRQALEQVGEVADCAGGLAEHVAKITLFLDQDAQENDRTAFMSFWLSVVGLVFVLIGFIFQMLGSLPS